MGLKGIKEEKAKIDEKKRKAEQEKNDMYRKFEIAIKQLQGRAEYKNDILERKLSVFLRNLKYSLAHAIKAYNDAIRVYEAKLLEFGIPADELGIEPLVTNTSTMPAGLVAA